MAVASLLLQGLSLLKDLPAVDLQALAGQMHLQEYARRQVVYEKGETGADLYFVLAGRLQAVDFTIDAREVGLFFADPGQHFGEMAMLGSAQREETMIALGPAKVLRWPAHLAQAFCSHHPGVSWALLTLTAQRLRHAALQRRLLALPHPAQRVGAQLLELLGPVPTGAPPPLTIDHMPTHQELAIMINASRETVTRVFQQLQSRNMVQRDGNTLQVLDLPALQSLAAQGLDG